MTRQASEFKETEIGFVCPFVYGKGLPVGKRNAGNIPVYGSNGIVGWHDNSFLNGSCIIIGRKGSIGKIHYSEIPCWPIDTTFYIEENQNYHLKFIFYLLKYINLEDMDSDTSIPGLNRSAAHGIKINIPEKIQQIRISLILENLDDKIKNLQNQNEVLEQIAQTVFKSWFVDFDGVTEFEDSELGRIPQGWRVDQLDNIATFLNGLPLQKFRPVNNSFLPVIKIREMKNGISHNTEKAKIDLEEKFIVNNGDVLFSWSGSLELIIWPLDKGALNQHIFKVTSENYAKWFYYTWIKIHLDDFRRIAEGKVTTMGHIQRRHLSEALVLIPKHDELQKMNKIMEPIFEKYIQNQNISQNLIKTRNTLIPKLMSGEIRV